MWNGWLPWLALAAALPVGLLACALLVINNLRDIPSDTVPASARSRYPRGPAHPLAVHRLRAVPSWSRPRWPRPALALLALAALPLALAPIRAVRPAPPADPDRRAGQTGHLLRAFGALLTLGLAIRL